MNDPTYIAAAFVGILIIFQIISFWLFLRPRSATLPHDDAGGVAALQRQIESLERSLDTRMGESSQAMQRSMSQSMGLIAEITKEVTSVKEIGRETHKYAEQLQSLRDILTHPKQRGVLGETMLKHVLQNAFAPGGYQMQYAFASGEIVDAVVIIGEKKVPIDSKFSLENYNRFVEAKDAPTRARYERDLVADLKQHIEDTSKYIRPSEGTMDFAFMFIPSEGIYYDLLTNRVGGGTGQSLVEFAAGKRVLIVSPTSLLAYLQTVMQGLRALKIEEKAREIEARVTELGRHMGVFQDFYRRVGASLGTTVGHYNAGAKELGKIDKDVLRVSGETFGVEITPLDKPSEDA